MGFIVIWIKIFLTLIIIYEICYFFFQSISGESSSKKPRLDANISIGQTISDDLSMSESASALPSPTHSDASQGSSKYVGDPGGPDESSNEALVVDCDSPSRSNTPGM